MAEQACSLALESVPSSVLVERVHSWIVLCHQRFASTLQHAVNHEQQLKGSHRHQAMQQLQAWRQVHCSGCQGLPLPLEHVALLHTVSAPLRIRRANIIAAVPKDTAPITVHFDAPLGSCHTAAASAEAAGQFLLAGCESGTYHPRHDHEYRKDQS